MKNSLTIRAALKREIDIFGDLLREPNELASANASSTGEIVLTKNYAANKPLRFMAC